MLYASLTDSPNNVALLRSIPPFARALAWLDDQDLATLAEGRYDILDNDRLFAMVMEYETVDVAEARFESHRKYVDLQLTISGCEEIEYHRADLLKPDGGFDAEKDLQFYLSPESAMGRVRKDPGCYSIWFPEDAHRPKLRAPEGEKVRKVVFKIALELF